MNAYLISLEDRPGAAASIFEAASRRGVNIYPAYGLADGTRGLICVGSDDEAGLQGAIADAGHTAAAIELVVADLDNKPGTGAALLRRLADAGVNLQVAVPIGMSGDRVQLALGAADVAALKAALG